MNERARRNELKAHYQQTRPEAGVYRIVNSGSGKALLGSTLNLAGVRNKLEFAKSNNMPSVLDHRLTKDTNHLSIDSFAFEVLEVLEAKPEQTPAQVLADLAALESLWREKLDQSLPY